MCDTRSAALLKTIYSNSTYEFLKKARLITGYFQHIVQILVINVNRKRKEEQNFGLLFLRCQKDEKITDCLNSRLPMLRAYMLCVQEVVAHFI